MNTRTQTQARPSNTRDGASFEMLRVSSTSRVVGIDVVLGKDLRADPVALVDREGTSIAGEELRSEARCRGGYQRIVGAASGNALVGQLQNEAPVIRGIQPQERVGKARREKIANDRTGRAMRRRQARENGEGFQRAMLDEAKPTVERTSSGFMAFVPGRKGRDDETGVGSLQRRTRSSVSRT